MSGMEERRGARLFLELDEPASMHTNMLFRLSGTVHASFFVAPLLTCICPVPVPTFPLVLFFMPFLFPFSWYTDNGLFLTSGRDGKLKVWDPNAQLPIEEFTGTVRNVNKPLVPPGSNGNIYERKKIRF